MVPRAVQVFEELHAFLRVCVRFFRGETTLQLLEIVIHHGEIKPLGGWQAVAFATRTLGGRLGHSTSTNRQREPFQPGPARGTNTGVNWKGRCLFMFQGDNQVLRGSKRC